MRERSRETIVEWDWRVDGRGVEAVVPERGLRRLLTVLQERP